MFPAIPNPTSIISDHVQSATSAGSLEVLDKYVISSLVFHAASVILNAAVAWILVYNSLFDFPSNRFLLSLCVSHFVASLSTLTISFTWLDKTEVDGVQTWDVVYFHLLFASAVFNTLMLICIACERYITIARPMRYKSIVTSTRCSLVVVAGWLLAAFVTLVPFVQFDRTDYEIKRGTLEFYVLIFLTVTVIALFVMCVCYYAIFKIAKEKCQRIEIGRLSIAPIPPSGPVSPDAAFYHRTCPDSGLSSAASSARPSLSSHKPLALIQHLLMHARNSTNLDFNRLQLRSRRYPVQTTPKKTVATITALVVSLLVTQLPIAALLANPGLWRLCLVLYSVSAVANPVLYGFLNRKIRVKMWESLRHRHPVFGGRKCRLPYCRCGQHDKLYSEILKDIVLHAAATSYHPAPALAKVRESPMAADNAAHHDLNQQDDFVPPMPRKDSHDSGADLTFSGDEDEEEVPNAVVVVVNEEQHQQQQQTPTEEAPHPGRNVFKNPVADDIQQDSV